MPTPPLSDQACSVARALEVVGDWWSLLIVRNLFYGIRRFNNLAAQLGVSRRVLTERLNTLERHGVLERRRYQEHPPRDEYRLTPMGVDLFPVMMALMQWGDRWLGGKRGAPLQLRHARCGQPAPSALRCDCGEPLGAHNLRLHLRNMPAAELAAFEQAAGRRIFERDVHPTK